jgi:hypothetical protein
MQGFDVSELVPRVFVVESATRDDGGLMIAIRSAVTVADARCADVSVAACTVNIEDAIFLPRACE